MSKRELSFKAGFLAKLASDGVLPSALFKRVKSAAAGDPISLSKLMGGFYGEGRNLLGTAAGMAMPAAKTVALLGTGIPMAGGVMTGTLASKLDSPPEPDIEAMRKEELIKLYQRLTEEIRARRRMHESGV